MPPIRNRIVILLLFCARAYDRGKERKGTVADTEAYTKIGSSRLLDQTGKVLRSKVIIESFMVYINFCVKVGEKASQLLMACLADQINKGEKEIYLLISSPGGVVSEGVFLHNYIKSLPAKVITHNIGIVDSVANVVFLAGTERYAVTHSSFLFHGVGLQTDRPMRFDEKELREKIEVIGRDQKLISDIIVKNSKLSFAKVQKLFLETQTLTPKQAKAFGLVHEIKEVQIPTDARIASVVVA